MTSAANNEHCAVRFRAEHIEFLTLINKHTDGHGLRQVERALALSRISH